jgi:kumamolisin
MGLTVAPDTPGPNAAPSSSQAASQLCKASAYLAHQSRRHHRVPLAASRLTLRTRPSRPVPASTAAHRHGPTFASRRAGFLQEPLRAAPQPHTGGGLFGTRAGGGSSTLRHSTIPHNIRRETIGILKPGGGYRTTDITAYFKSIEKTPKVSAVLIDGGKSSPSNANSADGEVMLDIEVAAAVAPGANIVVYFAPNTDQGFIDAVAAAIHDTKNKPSVVSISWGAPESGWTAQAMTAFDAACQSAAALGVTITAAAGDNGSTDGVTGGQPNRVGDIPASSPTSSPAEEPNSGQRLSQLQVVWNGSPTTKAQPAAASATSSASPWQARPGPKPTNSAGAGAFPTSPATPTPPPATPSRRYGKHDHRRHQRRSLWAGLIAVANETANRRLHQPSTPPKAEPPSTTSPLAPFWRRPQRFMASCKNRPRLDTYLTPPLPKRHQADQKGPAKPGSFFHQRKTPHLPPPKEKEASIIRRRRTR